MPAFLRRLGLSDPGPRSVAGLRRLHRAFVERVPYENLDIQLQRLTTVDPYGSIARVLRGRGGYCFHLNGAFSTLLRALGYQIRWHVGGARRNDEADPVRIRGDHLALTAHGLPSPECPDGVWLVDVGLGDGLYEPLPLRPGEYRQGPFRYGVARSPVTPGGWRLRHDPAGSFAAMDFGWPAAGLADFTAMHEYLSTSPESGFVRTAVVQRRDATGVDQVRGCVLSRVDGAGVRSSELTTQAEWFAALADVFGLTLDDLDPAARGALWRRVRAAHEAWRAEPAA